MKTVVICHKNMSKKYSGATRTVYEQIRFFNNANYKVYVIADTLNKKDVAATANENIIFLKTFYWPWQKGLQRRLRYAACAKKIIQKIQPDMTISHGDYPSADYFFTHNNVCLASERIHGVALCQDREMYQTHVPIFKGKEYKKIIANSKIVKDDICKRFDLDTSLVDVIYPSVNKNEFPTPSQLEIDTLKNNLQIDKDLLLVGLVTSGAFKKRNLKQYFDAIDLLPKGLAEKCYFIFVGKDTVYPEAVASLQENKYKHRIKHIPIIDEVSVLFNALDLLVLPARIEEFGRVVAEAMACSTPVITNQWVGASELLEGVSKTCIYNTEDTSALADIMKKVLSDKSLRDKLAYQNKVSVEAISEENTYKILERVLT